MKVKDILNENEMFHYALTGEEANAIMQRAWNARYPSIELYASGIDEDQPVWTTQEGADNSWALEEGEFLVLTSGTADIVAGQQTEVGLHEAYSGKYKGVIGNYFAGCFQALENRLKSAYPDAPMPPRKIYLGTRDGSDGAWEAIAKKLNAELEDHAD